MLYALDLLSFEYSTQKLHGCFLSGQLVSPRTADSTELYPTVKHATVDVDDCDFEVEKPRYQVPGTNLPTHKRFSYYYTLKRASDLQE